MKDLKKRFQRHIQLVKKLKSAFQSLQLRMFFSFGGILNWNDDYSSSSQGSTNSFSNIFRETERPINGKTDPKIASTLQ